LFSNAALPIDGIAELLPALGPQSRDVIRRQQVWHLEARGVRVRVQNERVVRLAEITRRVAVR